jgi:biopolymer transport protein ExbD
MNLKNPTQQNDFFPDLTPLIDMMFLLLIFFMLTSTFKDEKKIETVEVELPQAEISIVVPREAATVIRISDNGAYHIGDKPCTMDVLLQALDIQLKATRDSVVIISGHKNAPYWSIIHVYDVLQALGIKHFAHEVQ